MRIIVADDHPLFLEAVQRQIAKAFRGAEVCTFSRFADALAFLAEQEAHLVMLDYSMPELAGEGLKQAVAAARGAPVVVMSGVASAPDVAGCIAAGARGFLPKTMEGQIFIAAISLVMQGGTYLPVEFIGNSAPPPIAATEAAIPDVASKLSELSPKEHDLLRMVAAGATNKEIARKMGLQEVTVKFYLTRLFRRLDVKNRSQAAVLAVQLGLTSPQE